MKQTVTWWQVWSRLFLWAHAIGVAAFYFIILQRTVPNQKDRVKELPIRDEDERLLDRLTRRMPTVSIIVPARNEEHNINRCIQSLLEQDYEHFVVIAVDDGSTDKTSRIL